MEEILDQLGIEGLYPHQEEMLEFLDGNTNGIVVAPTSSGKTMPVFDRINRCLEKGKRACYFVPMKSLKEEKLKRLDEIFGEDFRVSDSLVVGEEKADIYVDVFEGALKRFLNSRDLLDFYSFAIFDDFHVLYSDWRGFNLEKLITLFRMKNENLVFLSATIGSLDELSDWIGGDWKKWGNKTRFTKLEREVVEQKSPKIENIINLKQAEEIEPVLIFNSTRPYSRNRAKSLAEKFSEGLLGVEPLSDDKMEKVESVLRENVEVWSSLEADLLKCIKYRTAWHTAGLPTSLKGVIEELYENGKIKYLFATTTLAYGFNSPTKTVILADTTRYDPEEGKSVKIPVHEFDQMAGRAGRGERFDKGNVYILSSDPDVDQNRYIENEEFENVKSKISEDDLYNKTILQLIEAGFEDVEDIENFFKNTFHGFKYQKYDSYAGTEFSIPKEVEEKIEALSSRDFVKVEPGRVILTDFGKTTNNFVEESKNRYYLRSFSKFRKLLREFDSSNLKEGELLNIILNTFGQDTRLTFKPRKRKSQREKRNTKDKMGEEGLPEKNPDSVDYSRFAYQKWIEGGDLSELEGLYGKWILYAKRNSEELGNLVAFAKKLSEIYPNINFQFDLDILEKSVKYGYSGPGLELFDIEGFGRTRIRNLRNKFGERPKPDFVTGYENWVDALKSKVEEREKLTNFVANEVNEVGNTLAERLFDYLESCST